MVDMAGGGSHFATDRFVDQNTELSVYQDTQNDQYSLYYTTIVHYHLMDDTTKHHTGSTITHFARMDISAYQ